MSSVTERSAVAVSAAAERARDTELFVATCRARPWVDDPREYLPLDGGDYQVAWAMPNQRKAAKPLSFAYGNWTTISHRKGVGSVADVLPQGDVLLVVHGFHETALDGVDTGEKIEAALDAQQRSGGISKALSGGKPASQAGALRLAHAFRRRLPTDRPLYQHLIAFTWPCTASIFPGYLLDKEEVARFAAFSLANLLADLRSTQPDRRILLVAHSMGCFLTLKALNILAVLRSTQPDGGGSPVIVDQMVFYAPDVNADALESVPLPAATVRFPADAAAILQRSNGYGFQALDRVGRLTIYSSFHDNVLIWAPFGNLLTEESGGWAGRARLGWCGPYNIERTHNNVVAVDCSACVYDHGAYFTRHEVLRHTARTLAEPPLPTPQRAARATLQTTAEDGQQRAKRLWTWYTPAEITREWWERVLLYQPRWVRWLAMLLSLLMTLAALGGVLFKVVEFVF